MSSASVIPVGAQPMRTLTMSMAIMCYLATLALGGLMLIEAAASQWISGIASEMTVEVRPQSMGDARLEAKKAIEILNTTPGVTAVREIARSETRELLEPWLGDISAFDHLPLPILISVAIDQARPPDVASLEKRLAERVAGATLDTHARWQSQLARTAFVLRRLGFAVLGLIALSATGLVIFATRSVLDANRGVIEILHLVGARDSFIAGAIKGRFLRSGFLAGLFGTLGGIATFALLGLIGTPAGSSSLAKGATDLLIAAPAVAAATYAVFLLVPICATLLSLATAHLAVMRQLRAA
jgi:cell division transport system permease protein